MLTPALVSVILMLLLGLLAQRMHWFEPGAPRVLNLVVIRLCLPALVWQQLAGVTIDSALLRVALVPWSIALLMALGFWVIWRRWRISKDLLGCLLLLSILGNTAYLGYPMVNALAGPEAMPAAVIYDQLGSFLLLSMVAPIVIAFTAGRGAPQPLRILRDIVLFPGFIALLVGLCGLPIPPLVAPLISVLASMLVPLAMLSVGLQWQLKPARADRLPLAIGLLSKMGLGTALAIGFSAMYGIGSDWQPAVILQAAMPPMITAGILASEAGLRPTLSAALVGYGLLLGLLLLPLLGAVLG